MLPHIPCGLWSDIDDVNAAILAAQMEHVDQTGINKVELKPLPTRH